MFRDKAGKSGTRQPRGPTPVTEQHCPGGFMYARACLIVLILVSAVLSAGCGKMQKTKECNEFIDKVNTSLKEIEKHTNQKTADQKSTVAEMKKLADLYDRLATDLGALTIGTPALKKHSAEYQTMAKKAAAAARQHADALETNDVEKSQTAQKEFDGIVKQEDQLVNNINNFCQAS
jgi:hypothetical protein